MNNKNLHNAKNSKNDEFYTQYTDIQKEIDAYLEYNPNVFRDKTILLPCDDPEWSNFTKIFVQNFEKFGLKKLISTCYTNTKNNCQADLFENDCSQNFNSHGKILTLTKDNLNSKWQYLKGDGDFRSSEIKALRDECDFIITNPPFSLFREFVSWIFETDKKFLIIGNMNAVTYKEIFPLIKDNKMWYGVSISSGDRRFNVPDSYPLNASGCGIDDNNQKYIQVKGVRWYTNIDHGKRHKPLSLLTMNDNLRFNKKLKNPKYQNIYKKYDNYDAIEIPLTEVIPSDYEGIMGVPISFLDKYCPEQFELLGITQRNDDPYKIKKYTTNEYKNANDLNARATILNNGIPKSLFPRILIRIIK